MKNPIYLIVLLALGLVVVSYKWIAGGIGASVTEAGNVTVDDIMTRSSVRAYTGRAVAKETVDTLLRAAMAAPSAGNKQPWRMVVIDDRATLTAIGEKFQSMKMASSAALAVVMCGDTTATFPGEGRDYWVQDVSAASENLLLAAHAMGIGAVWCGIYPISQRITDFSQMLDLPANIIPMACICIGYPEGMSEPKDKWRPEHVCHNVWGQKYL
ncbi:MAG: nitroreductase family protein [Muribaculaceae bacterium]